MEQRRRSAKESHLRLAREILSVAQERGAKRGDHLPEQLYSELCGVSRTPIRSAFKILFERDILSWREDEGYFLDIDGRDLAQAQDQLDTMERSLAEIILADRSQRRIGDVQSVSALARKYGTSRHSVLNALKILSQTGVVSQLPGRSWVFQPLLDSPRAIDQSLSFRMVIEPLAILEPGFQLDRGKASTLARRMQDMLAVQDSGIRGTVFHNLDTDFHSLIGEGSANRFARSTILAHQKLRRATQTGISIPDFRLRQALREHLDILDNLGSGQFELAADLMVVHLRRSRTARPEAANRGAPPMLRRGN